MLDYGGFRTTWNTLLCKYMGRSDFERWADKSNFDDWQERTQIVAGLIPKGVRVIDFGAGRRLLEQHLDPASSYTPSDIVDRGPGTIVFDLNRRPLPDLRSHAFDVGVLAGVLEYVVDVATMLCWLQEQMPTCVASYGCATSKRGSAARLRERLWRTTVGWTNTFDEMELLELFDASGWNADAAVDWHTPEGSERIFRFTRRT